MNAKMMATGVGIVSLATAALAQTEVYESGILHQAVGSAQLGPVQGRRLPVRNLGSSGQDGVDIQLNSAWGGGTGVEMDQVFTAGREIRIRPRGWDGTIKGRLAITGNANGTATLTADFSEIGAIGLDYQAFDANGHLVSEGSFPDSGVELDVNGACPPGSTPISWIEPHWVDYPAGHWEFWTVWGCIQPADPHLGGPDPTLLLIPVLPAGVPPLDGIQSLEVTAAGLPEVYVRGATEGTFGVSSFGLGQAQLVETCDASPCTRDARRLEVHNLGSSGQDGVAIDLGDDVGGMSLRSKKCPDCPPGHVTLIKFYDEQARVMMSVPTSSDPATGMEQMTLDFSGIGVAEFDLTLLDGDGGVLSSSRFFSGVMLRYLQLCQPPAYAVWQWIAGHWYFMGCHEPMGIVLPDGTTVGGVASMEITPVSSDSRPPRRCAITSTGDGGPIVVYGVTVTPACPGDVNGDGVVDLSDLAILLAHFGISGGATLADGDLNGDGNVDLSDLASLLSSFGTTCP